MTSPLRWLAVFVCLMGIGVGKMSPLAAQTPAPLSPDDKAAMLLNSARLAYNEQNYPFAAERFREFLKTYGGHREVQAARYGLGLSLLNGGVRDYAAAIEPLSHAAVQADFADRPFALYYLGLAHRGVGQQELAAAVEKPNEAPQHKQAALQAYERAAQQFAAAVPLFQARVKNPVPGSFKLPEDLEWAARARCDLAEMLLAGGKLPEARQAAEAFVAEPNFAKSRCRGLALYYQGYAAFQLKDYQAAGKSLSLLAPFKEPEYGVHAQYLLARTHHLAGERAEAAKLYAAVTAGYEYQKQTAQQALGNANLAKENPTEKARLEALLKAPPEFVSRTVFYWGVLLGEEGKFAEAAARFAPFAQQFPTSPLAPEAQLRLGISQVQLKQFAEATKTLAPLEANPALADQVLLWMSRADLGVADPNNPQQVEGVLKTAIERQRRAADQANARVAQEPEAKVRRVEILLDLADTQLRAKQFNEAVGVYQAILRENQDPPRNEETLARLAAAMQLAGQYPQSDAECQKFVQQFPQSSLMAQVLFRQAENAFLTAQAAAAKPDLPDLPNRDAELAKLFGESIKRYQGLIEKFPEAPQVQLARQGLGLSFYRLAKYEEAIPVLSAIPDSDRTGELAGVGYQLGSCLVQTMPRSADDALAAGRLLEQSARAVQLLEGFIASQPQHADVPDALLKVGHCHQQVAAQMVDPNERNKVLALARASYDKLLTQFANHPLAANAFFERAKVMAIAGDIGGAINELNRFQQEPFKNAAIAPLACVRLAVLLRSQNKAAEAVNVLAACRAAHEPNLVKDPTRIGWIALLQYHQGLALRDAGKPAEALPILDGVAKQFPNRPEGVEGALAAGRCRKEMALARYDAARAALSKPGAKPEELTAAAKERETGLTELRSAAQYFQDQTGPLASAKGTEPFLRLWYESAWCHRQIAEAEIADTLKKLEDEAAKKLADEAAKRANTPGATPAPVSLRPPVVPLSAVPQQPSEKRAREQYQALIAASPAPILAADARLELAEMQAQRDEIDPAIALLTQAIELDAEGAPTLRIRLRLGSCYLAKKDPVKAQGQFLAVAQDVKSPLAPEGKYRLAEALIEQKDWPKAIEQLVPFRDQQPLQNLPGVSDRALLRLGYAYAQAAQWEPSRQAYEILLQRFPQSAWAHDARYGMGWAWQNLQNYDQAVNVYAQITAATAGEVAAKAQLQTGLCRLEQKRTAEAANALLVVPFTYDYPELSALALCEAARAFEEMQQGAQSGKLLDRVIKEYPKSPWAEVAKERRAKIK